MSGKYTSIFFPDNSGSITGLATYFNVIRCENEPSEVLACNVNEYTSLVVPAGVPKRFVVAVGVKSWLNQAGVFPDNVYAVAPVTLKL